MKASGVGLRASGGAHPGRRVHRLRGFLVALALLVLGALVLSLGEKEPVSTRRPRVDFPNRMRPAEEERAEKRATLALPAPPPRAGEEPEEPALRDPFLVALPVQPGQPVIVLEANALRHSRLGERFLACLLARDPDAIDRIVRETGVDPLKDIDRVGVAGDSLVVSGYFDRLHRERLEREADVSSYGERGRVYAARRGGGTLATWGDNLLIMGGSEDSMHRAIDQLEGRVEPPETGIPEDMAYGEAYGVIPGEAIRRVLGRSDPALAQRLAEAASRVELHVDAMEDVAAVVRVRGDDEGRMSELARSIGAALAVARVEAQATEDRRTAELLESARVVDRDGSFSVELAVAADRLEQFFEGCERPPAREGAPDAAEAPGDPGQP